jgi:hypothetical protein
MFLRFRFTLPLALGAILVAPPSGECREISRNADPAENVNSRYTVESVELLGFAKARLSKPVRERMDKLVGAKYDTLALSSLVWKLREEVKAKHINIKVGRGLKPEHLAVRLEVEGQRDKSFELTAPKFGYQSRQGYSGMVEGVINAGSRLRLAGGYSNDGDALLERYQGFHGRVEFRLLTPASSRVPLTLRFRYASLRQGWNRSTTSVPAVADADARLYGEREVFEPVAVTQVPGVRGLTWSAGANIQRLMHGVARTGGPGSVISPTAAPQAESSNAVVTTLRYRRQFEGSGAHQQELEAGYDLRAATQILASDYVYNRHAITGTYRFQHGRHHELKIAALAGFLNGTAPYYDRFVAGNSQTLRGYSKFDLTPLGANRIVHGSIDYRWRLFQAFYDAGSIAEAAVVAAVAGASTMSDVKHSVGVGLRKDNIQLAVAFPLRGVRMDPIFLLGVNF